MSHYQAIFWSPVCLFPHSGGKHGQVQGYLSSIPLDAWYLPRAAPKGPGRTPGVYMESLRTINGR
jgi:hypothetical protein